MIDLSKLKAPGWQRVVAELSAPAPDDRSFLMRLTAMLGQVSGARQAALFEVSEGEGPEESEPRAVFIWPVPGGGAGGGGSGGARAAELQEPDSVRGAARSAGDQVRVFGLERNDQFYDAGRGGYVIGVPLTGVPMGPGVRAVATLLIDGRSEAAMQTTLALVEVLAGYTNAHAARQELGRTKQAGAALDLAGRLISSINSAKGFRGAVFQLVNDLSRQVGADRVALGWVKQVGHSGSMRVVGMSDTEHVDRRLAMVQKLEAAMEECLDQEQPVVYPPPPESGAGGDALLAGAITHAHRDLCASDAKLHAASLPLRSGEEVVGVITIEAVAAPPSGPAAPNAPQSAPAVDPATIELLQATLDLVAPVLELRRRDNRALPLRAWDSVVKAGAWAVGPRHTVWKMIIVLVFAGFVAAATVQVPYRVEAEFELRPREQRYVSAPFPGRIIHVPEGIEPGAQVEAGQLLVEFDTQELSLDMARLSAKVQQERSRLDAARKARKISEEEQAAARIREFEADLARVRYYMDNARLLAPISGTIVEGDPKRRIGSSASLGDVLVHVARLEDMVVVARVDDRDIKLVQEAAGSGRHEVVTKAYPSLTFPIVIEKIVPLAQADQGTNAFEVHATLVDGAPGWMRPGMEGIARLDTGRRTILDIGMRRIRDTLRLWLWR